jgi:hypothetical protein
MTYLWTPTYRDAPTCREQVVYNLRQFFKHWPTARWGPYLWVVERGTQGTKRLHAHILANRFIPVEDMQWYWWHGNIDIGDRGELRGEQDPRKLAAYAAKYVSKDTDELVEGATAERADGKHRYGVAQGFTPQPWAREFPLVADCDDWVRRVYGQWDDERSFGDEPDAVVWGRFRTFDTATVHRWRQSA